MRSCGNYRNACSCCGEKAGGKVDKETCRKLAMEKYKVQDGRALNKAIKPAVQRCMQNGPSAL
jgi:hypothetical protein